MMVELVTIFDYSLQRWVRTIWPTVLQSQLINRRLSQSNEKWIRGQRIRNLLLQSVIILDNASYNCMQVDEDLSKYAVKSKIINSLASEKRSVVIQDEKRSIV